MKRRREAERKYSLSPITLLDTTCGELYTCMDSLLYTAFLELPCTLPYTLCYEGGEEKAWCLVENYPNLWEVLRGKEELSKSKSYLSISHPPLLSDIPLPLSGWRRLTVNIHGFMRCVAFLHCLVHSVCLFVCACS